MTRSYLTEHDFATLAEMKERCPLFFENGDIDGHKESFYIRENHLIVMNAVSKKRVFQFYWNGSMWRLHHVWTPNLKWSLAKVLFEVERKLESGEYPQYKWDK